MVTALDEQRRELSIDSQFKWNVRFDVDKINDSYRTEGVSYAAKHMLSALDTWYG